MKYISLEYIIKLHDKMIDITGGSKGISRFRCGYSIRKVKSERYNILDRKS
jgi:hypothetical protein